MKIYYVFMDYESMGSISRKDIMDYPIKNQNEKICNDMLSIINRSVVEKGKINEDKIRMLIVMEKCKIYIDKNGVIDKNGKFYKLEKQDYLKLLRLMTPLFGGSVKAKKPRT